jgi:uncharacterized protein (DUF1800 family)
LFPSVEIQIQKCGANIPFFPSNYLDFAHLRGHPRYSQPMNLTRFVSLFVALATLQFFTAASIFAADPELPAITNFTKSGSNVNIRFSPLYPAAQSYAIQSATNLSSIFTSNANFLLSSYVISSSTNGTNYGYQWRATNIVTGTNFFRLAVTPMSSNAVLAATALSRLAYGSTPDELTRITNIGPQAYIDEQLAPWSIVEDVTNTHANFATIEAKFVPADGFVWRTNATLSDFRAWHILRAIGAKRQLLEVILQFLENHFVTQYSKSVDYFDQYYDDGTYQQALSTQFEFLENDRWRNALLNSNCTFLDLLKISAESPAQIIYLDTVTSRGDTTGTGANTRTNVANENYAREIMELFCMGVDNGYDQTDITLQSRIWTGWRVEKVDFTNAFNPFAARTTQIFPGSTNTSTTSRSNLFGAWAFNYQPSFHYTNSTTVFQGKTIPSRYGAPWTTKTYFTNNTPGLYQIFFPGRASTTATNGIQQGYDFMTHIANLPFTEEYISIKLCRLLVHDDFPNPSNNTNDEAYAFYNYAGGNLSPEADLVYQCMLTWETNSPKGQIWKVLKTITDSDLFRTHAASQHKVKTPLEHTVAAVRSLRSSTNGSNAAGSFTSYSDGYGIGGSSVTPTYAPPLARMGNMLLFERDAPDGYPEAGPPWISAGTLAERVRFVQSFCIASGQVGHNGNANSVTNDANTSVCNIVGLLQNKTPASTWTNAAAVADYFLSILYPGEGAGNLLLYRQAAINFLNDGSADTTPNSTPFASMAVSTSATSDYDKRVRGMVGMLMTMQRFQEQ